MVMMMRMIMIIRIRILVVMKVMIIIVIIITVITVTMMILILPLLIIIKKIIAIIITKTTTTTKYIFLIKKNTTKILNERLCRCENLIMTLKNTWAAMNSEFNPNKAGGYYAPPPPPPWYSWLFGNAYGWRPTARWLFSFVSSSSFKRFFLKTGPTVKRSGDLLSLHVSSKIAHFRDLCTKHVWKCHFS